jgi:Family of unknown function (DUF6292)
VTSTLTREPGGAVGTGLDMERALRVYLADVAAAVGVGPESCTVDIDRPMSAYLALDQRSPRFPDRDLALLWDERRGWSVAVESGCHEDLLVIGELGRPAWPRPTAVRRFLDRILAGVRV